MRQFATYCKNILIEHIVSLMFFVYNELQIFLVAFVLCSAFENLPQSVYPAVALYSKGDRISLGNFRKGKGQSGKVRKIIL